MPFDAIQEAKAQIGETEFYGFDFGPGMEPERYTTQRKRIQAFGEWWEPLAITRGRRTAKGDVVADDSRLVMPCRPSFVSIVAETGLETVACTISRGFGTDYANDYKAPWWVGYLTEITVTANQVQGVLRGTESLFQELIPKVMVQPGCNNRLGDGVCGVNLPSFEETRSVSVLEAGGRLLTLNGTIPPNDTFTRGRIRRLGGNQTVEIMSQQGPQFVLHLPLLGLQNGDQVVITPGCLKRPIEDCLNRYSNKDRFVGMANVPNTQPVTDGF